uniref:Uncharacterized protein n=1 Tax=Junco hyemalis TaxID=40217 RepID=A0A8C5JTG4_JUNHY
MRKQEGGCCLEPGLSCRGTLVVVCGHLGRDSCLSRSRSLVMGEQIGPPSRPSSPNPQERVLKCGWLKKQRSIMKNWQQRVGTADYLLHGLTLESPRVCLIVHRS